METLKALLIGLSTDATFFIVAYNVMTYLKTKICDFFILDDLD